MEGGAEETGREDIGMRRMKDDVGKETGKGRGGRESLLRDQIDKNASSLFLKTKNKKTMMAHSPSTGRPPCPFPSQSKILNFPL